MKPILILQHDPLQQPGYLLDFLDERDVPSVIIRPCDGDSVPRRARAFSGIVALGSDNSVNDPEGWIRSELELARNALETDVPMLGHCFGGQLMARAMGQVVRRNACPNIGWSTLKLTSVGQALFGHRTQVQAFNWHYETFGIPRGAQRTLFGAYCLNKGFVIGKHMAFQCHFEVTEAIVRAWCEAHRQELSEALGPAVQSETQILTCLPERVATVHVAARAAYAAWLAPLGVPRACDPFRFNPRKECRDRSARAA